MRNWVIPFLRGIRPEMISVESYERELEQPPFVWRRLAGLFLHCFESEEMETVVGSVLSDLPESAFNKILSERPFFVLAKGPAFIQKLHTPGDLPLIIFCETDLIPMSWSERRGCIVHELSHLYLGHIDRPFSLDDPFRRGLEGEADDQCRGWGFGGEIESVRTYLKKGG